jgi:rod shape-determining protein MreD
LAINFMGYRTAWRGPVTHIDLMARRPAGLRRNMNFWRRLDMASRHAWPAGIILFGMLVIGLPLGLPGLADMRPAFVMGSVFFWCLYRPASLPAPVVACIGLLLDLLGMTPMGLWAVLLLVLQGSTLAARRRLIPQSFLMTWAVFIGFAAVISVCTWGLQAALELRMLPLAPTLAQVAVAGGIYPALAGFFIRAHRGSAAAELA